MCVCVNTALADTYISAIRTYIYIYCICIYTALADTYISAIRTIFFGVLSIAQLVEVTDSAVLGGVAEIVIVSSRWVIEYFQHLPA